MLLRCLDLIRLRRRDFDILNADLLQMVECICRMLAIASLSTNGNRILHDLLLKSTSYLACSMKSIYPQFLRASRCSHERYLLYSKSERTANFAIYGEGRIGRGYFRENIIPPSRVGKGD